MSNKHAHALTLLATPEFKVSKSDLKSLQQTACEQVAAVGEMEKNAAIGGILAGLTLHRVKVSLPTGKFRAFQEGALAKARGWTPSTAVKNTSFLMRLATVFLSKAKLDKTNLLALPHDGNAITLDVKSMAALKGKLTDFVADLSLNELLIKHDIKSVGLKTALTAEAAAEDPTPLTPEQIAEAAREAAWQDAYTFTQQLRASLTEPDKAQHLNAERIATLKAELIEINRALDDRAAALRKK